MRQNKALNSPTRCDLSVHRGYGFVCNAKWNILVSVQAGANINAENADVVSLTAP
jgi:hypothetical protein